MKQLLKLIIILLAFMPVFAFSQTNNNYIAIDYSSICCGTPSEKHIMDFVKNFEKKNKLKSFEMFVEWGLGKEGEHAYYIGIDNLNSELLNSFWNGLKITASNQNKQRKENYDGYVDVDNKFTPNSILKSIKIKPRTRISSLDIYNYKK